MVIAQTATLAAIRAAVASDRTQRRAAGRYWRLLPSQRTAEARCALALADDADTNAKRAAMRACGVTFRDERISLDDDNQRRAYRVLAMIERLSRREA